MYESVDTGNWENWDNIYSVSSLEQTSNIKATHISFAQKLVALTFFDQLHMSCPLFFIIAEHYETFGELKYLFGMLNKCMDDSFW